MEIIISLKDITGFQSGYFNTASYNHFTGYQAGLSNTTGTPNHFEGYQAGFANTTGSQNHYSGYAAGYKNTTGFSNTFLGYQTGHENVTGSGNVMIGHLAGYNETSSNKLYISNSATANPLVFGDFTNQYIKLNGDLRLKKTIDNGAPMLRLTDVVSDYTKVIYESTGYPYYWATISSGAEENIGYSDFSFYYSHFADNNGRIFSISTNGNAYLEGTLWESSDQRLKKNITPYTGALNKIKQLRAVTYEWKNREKHNVENIGFVAQELEQIIPQLVTTKENGYKAVAYSKMVPVLVEAIKEQQKMIDELKQAVDELKTKN